MSRKMLNTLFGAKAGGAVHMQDGGDPTQMFNFNPMAAKAAKQKQMRESTPETPLGALAKGFGTGLFGSTEEQVPYSGSIMEGSPQRQQSQANLREIGRNIGALTDIGGMVTPFAKPAAQAITRGATALGRTGLEQVDRAMFGEGPLASLVAPVTPLQAVPRVQAPVSRLGFYDPVEQAGLNIQRKQGPGQAFLNELQRSENVSKDFLESSGIAEKLRTAPNITRDEVQAMTKGAVPEVEELVLGDVKGMAFSKEQKIASQLASSIDSSPKSHINLTGMQGPVFSDEALYYLQDGTVTPDQFPEGLQQLARDYINAHKAAQETKNIPTKFDREDLILPGGNNYREVLLTVPSKRPSIKNMSRAEYNAAIEEADRLGIQNFESSHWDEPNVVAHIRMNDRTDFNGKKVLFIEEIQSDWAQQGRKHGFKDDPTLEDQFNKLAEEHRNVVAKRSELVGDSQRQDEYKALADRENVLLKEMNKLHDAKQYGPPTGPFVRNTNEWVDLSLKNILKRAVDEGYDRVAFINGKQSADRYKLTNYVDRVEFLRRSGGIAPGPEKMGDGLLIAYDKQGRRAIEKYINDPERELPDVIGKEASQKLLEQKPEQTRFAGEGAAKWSLQGAGLEVGGKGMKDFYDRIVPDRLKKIAKQDLKPIDVGTRERRFEGESEMPEGRPIGIRELNNGMLTLDLEGSSTGWGMWSPSERQNAERALKRFQQKYSESVPQQLGIDITPEIRERFSKPIPYKEGGAVKRVHISDNPDTMLLELMRNKRYG